MKKQWLGLLTILCLTISCGDDKNDAESDTSEKAVSSICDCVEQGVKQLKENGKLDPELEEKCKKMAEEDPKAQMAMMQCDGIDELMKLSMQLSDEMGDMSDVDIDMSDFDMNDDDAEATTEVDCDELLEQYEVILAKFHKLNKEVEDNPDELSGKMIEASQVYNKVMKFSGKLQNSNCMQDEDFKKRMLELENQYH